MLDTSYQRKGARQQLGREDSFKIMPMNSLANSVNISKQPVMFLNILNALLGVSIFAMPWGFVQSGLFGGIFVLFFVAFLSFDTATVLLKTQRVLFFKTGNVYGFPEICSNILGPIFSPIVKIATCISCLGGCAGYLIFLGELCSQLFSVPFASAVLLSAIPLILVSWIRTFKELYVITILGVFSLVIAVIAVLYDGSSNQVASVEDLVLIRPQSFLEFVGPVTFLFTIHYCVLSMGSEALIS
jgi:amino acid permease